jgi:hypothetical protein
MFFCAFGRISLLIGDGVEAHENSVVDSSTEVEKTANDLLDELEALSVERWRCIIRCDGLGVGAIFLGV